jgi:hypothetical protein
MDSRRESIERVSGTRNYAISMIIVCFCESTKRLIRRSSSQLVSGHPLDTTHGALAYALCLRNVRNAALDSSSAKANFVRDVYKCTYACAHIVCMFIRICVCVCVYAYVLRVSNSIFQLYNQVLTYVYRFLYVHEFFC